MSVAKEALKPRSWIEGYVTATKIAVPLILTTIMTGGMGDGAILSSEIKSTQIASPSSPAAGAAEANLLCSPSEVPKAANLIVDCKGIAFPIPEGAVAPIPNTNGKGVKFTGGQGGTNGQVSSLRIMDPTLPKGKSPRYSNGYIKYQNAGGQGVDPYNGRTLPQTASHILIDQLLSHPVSDGTYVKKPNVPGQH